MRKTVTSLLVLCFLASAWSASAAALNIVALGASTTAGRGQGSHPGGVDRSQACPAQLEAMLRAKGIDARVRNAGVPGDTTAGMLRRMNSSVPNGTQIVVLQAGGNDARRGVSSGEAAVNTATTTSKLEARGIKVVVLGRLDAPASTRAIPTASTSMRRACRHRGQPVATCDRGGGEIADGDRIDPLAFQGYFAAAAILGQSAICTRATRWNWPPIGMKIEASPSCTSNHSLPSASTTLGLWVMMTVFVPGCGAWPSMATSALARRAFSSGDTMSPPSVRSAVFLILVKPASTAVS
jgi:acyl-CoA thioesterase-1